MFFATLVARVGQGVVHADGGSATCNVVFGQVGVGGAELDVVVGSFGDGSCHGADEPVAAVGVDGVVASMVGYHHGFKAVAFGQSGGHAEHDSVAERHNGGSHVVVLIMPLGDGFGAAQKGAFKVFSHECEVDLHQLYAEASAVLASACGLPGVVVGSIIEIDGQCYLGGKFIEHCRGVHASRQH